MEEKKSVKISLGTAVCIFLIIILLLILGGMYYLNTYKNNENNDKNNTISEQNEISYKNKTNELRESKTEIKEEKNEKEEENNNKDLLNSSEIQKILGPEGAFFCIEDIERDGSEYIITAYMLEKESRIVTKTEYENLLNGGEIKFRNLKWEQDNNSQYQITNGIIIKSGDSKLAVGEDFGKWAIYNIAGIKENLNDYSEQKIEFKVSQNILIGGFFTEFRYGEDGNIKIYDIDGNEAKSFSFEELSSLSEGCRGSYEECKAYVRNGEVQAIKIFEK